MQTPATFKFKRKPQVSVAGLWLLTLAFWTGCAGLNRSVELPSADQFEREQLRISSDITLPRRHRLLDELTGLRRDISDRLLLPMSDEPIQVYLFDSRKRFQRYLKQNHPSFPDRRAFFVKNDTELKVYAYWGESVAEDLRHEVTHGYLHSIVPNIPLWLDEGLAEYFELPRGSEGFHRPHIFCLTDYAKQHHWSPSLARLESLTDPATFTQQDYAESWLWVHYLLQGRPDCRKLLQDQLARYRMTGDAKPLSEYLHEVVTDEADEVFAHLAVLAREMETEQKPGRHPSQDTAGSLAY